MQSPRRLSVALILAATTLTATDTVAAQRASGRLNGAVVDKATGQPVAGAVVVSLLDGKSMTTDTSGSYHFEKLPVGIVRFLVKASGFPQQALIVALAQGEAMERLVEMDSTAAAAAAKAEEAPAGPRPQQLALVKVEEAPSLGPRYANFERRKKTGAGHYLVKEEIERSGASNLQDAVRGLRGVTMDCGGGRGCNIRMVRAPMQCPPEYVVDDFVDNVFGPTIPVRDIEAIEVYTGPADVPGEYAGRNAGCGVIVIWTKSGPARRKKK
jgi:Carboxypeptidase regulatory-like domain/TonB-dependent Receptor Plug Domain